jgi:hypothetical protein
VGVVEEELSAAEARWLAMAAQGLDKARPRSAVPVGRARLRGLLDQLGTIQLDAVNVVARTQLLVPFSRLGPYQPDHLFSLSGPGRTWFEYWGHEASLLPVELYPLFKWRMALQHRHWIAWEKANRRYLAAVLAELSERGPLSAGQLSDPRRRDGEWWGRRSDGRIALEYLFRDGTVAAWRTANFERVYDLAERVIPPEVLAGSGPEPDEAQRQLLLRSARSLGVGDAADLANYFVLPIVKARQLVAELAEDGRLVPVRVQGWKQPGFTLPGATVHRPRRVEATLLSPFDSLIWRRQRTLRLFDFTYRIEIYVPQPKRQHGYHVLPLLLGDRLVARFDLKSDRQARRLLVSGAYGEPGADLAAIAEPAAAELIRLATWLGLDGVKVGTRGDLAPFLRKAVAALRR